jgi:pimeloyl-ACP methyl ester carboxylesterase
MATVRHQGLDIFYEDEGTGTPILLGHSFLCSGAMWRLQMPVLSERARVINMDYRGHGKSNRVQAPFGVEDLVDDGIALLDHLEVEKAVWGGLSIGGMVSMRAAIRYPERVLGLMLFATHAGAENPAKKMQYRAMGLMIRLFGMRPLAPSVARLMFGRTTRKTNRELVAEWKRYFAGNHVQTVLFFLQALLGRESVLEQLAEVRVPSLVVTGTEDAAIDPRLSREIADALPDSRLVEIPGAGHLCALERPAEVSHAIIEYLEAHQLIRQ